VSPSPLGAGRPELQHERLSRRLPQIRMLKEKSEAVRRQAASDLLDRCGLKAPDKTEVTGAEGKPISYLRGLAYTRGREAQFQRMGLQPDRNTNQS
jgi:hypothetical protein